MRAKSKRAKRFHWTILCWLSLVTAGVGFLFFHNRHSGKPPELSGGRNIFANWPTGQGSAEHLLSTLSWNDVFSTAEGVGSDKSFREEITGIKVKVNHPPALYLRALLLMAGNDPQSALKTFLLIPPHEIPPTHLYPPYRLHNVIRPSQPNPFLGAVNQAVAENMVQPLVRARVFATEGRLPESLKEYLKTDPADWADLDIRALRSLRMHAGLANNSAAMLLAALKGGRVPVHLRPQVVEILNAPRDKATLEDLKKQFLQQIDSDPAIRQAAITSAVQQVSLRQKFVGRRYRELLDEKHNEAPMSLPDETVLILTLSAAQLRDAPAFDCWSKELQRRYPTPEIQKWLSQLLTPTP